jgi:hypothetical protein
MDQFEKFVHILSVYPGTSICIAIAVYYIIKAARG